MILLKLGGSLADHCSGFICYLKKWARKYFGCAGYSRLPDRTPGETTASSVRDSRAARNVRDAAILKRATRHTSPSTAQTLGVQIYIQAGNARNACNLTMQRFPTIHIRRPAKVSCGWATPLYDITIHLCIIITWQYRTECRIQNTLQYL